MHLSFDSVLMLHLTLLSECPTVESLLIWNLANLDFWVQLYYAFDTYFKFYILQMFLQLHSWIKFYLEFALWYFQVFCEHWYPESASYSQWLNLTQYLFLEIRSDGSTAMPINLLTVYGCFCAVIVKESGHIAHNI